MSLKCSLFGHKYGDTEVRRDREQDGNELVETVQEMKVCARCGAELVISETTEVTTVEAAEGGPDSGSDAGRGAGGRPGTTSPGTGATGPPGGGAGPSGPGSESGPGDVGGEMGPPAGGTDPAGGLSQPDQEMPPAHKDDAIIIDEDGEEQPSSEWPDEDDEGENEDWEPETEPETEAERREPPAAGAGGGLTVPEGEFHCPECGFTTPVESSSLREGDFCPECHRGALEHRSD